MQSLTIKNPKSKIKNKTSCIFLVFAFSWFIFSAAATAQTLPASRPLRTGAFAPDHNPNLPTLFLIGDSTVKNSWDKGTDGLWGWGHPLAAYFDASKINVDNQALGGTSSHSYQVSNWPGVLALVKKGDFVMMQFGHNDNSGASLPGNGDETREVTGRNGQKQTLHTYGWYIRQYIKETHDKGATPIVCSLIPRMIWKDGKIVRATGSFATWAKAAADEEHADFIDLNSLIADKYDALGEAAVKPLFGKNEHTHTGWKGAVLNAQCVIEGIKLLKDCPLPQYFSDHPNPIKPATDPTDG